jgi:signal transduction histidine kinase
MLSRGDNSRVPIGISCAPLLDADGTRLGAVAIFQDLTEITLLQRQVLQTEKMASIGQLAAGVAHEINNPMGFIHANLFQMMEYLGDLRRLWGAVADLQKAVSDGDAGGAAGKQAADALASLSKELEAGYLLTDFEKAIRESQEGSERIRHIVGDLRDFSRQDRDERVQADVNQCVDSTANIVWSMMKHSVVLQKQYADLPRIRCNPMQLKQVFMNLLVNAYQAIEERVGDTGERGRIDLVTELRGPHVVIRVSDTGAGIAEDKLGRIFDPFFTTKEVGVGVGLGLSTSFGIVQKHGGLLRAQNRPGGGAVFEVVLPVAPSDTPFDQALDPPVDKDDQEPEP